MTFLEATWLLVKWSLAALLAAGLLFGVLTAGSWAWGLLWAVIYRMRGY